jgi:polyhydroxyalkanoate synthesis regulator phasin
MTTHPVLESLYQGFRLTVGATATLLETLQDPHKRADTLSDLQSQWNQIAAEWSEKGEVTEREARQFLEGWLARSRGSTGMEPIETVATESETPDSDTNARAEIAQLIERLTALRAELEKSRGEK